MKKIFLLLMGVVLLASQALATGAYIYFNDSPHAIKDKDGNSLDVADYHPYKDRLEFFRGNPADPINSAGKLTVDVGTQYTLVLGEHKYSLLSYDGGSIFVRVWKNTPSGDRKGNYYGKASYGVASGTTLPLPHHITGLKTEYKADVPNKPSIGPVGESLVRSGDNLQLTLSVPVNYNENNPNVANEKREVTQRYLKVEYPDGRPMETLTGNSHTLRNIPSGTYYFTPIAENWYGQTEGDRVPYDTLGVAVGGPETITVHFVKPTGDLGINTFSFPFASVSSPSAIANLKDLIEAVNNAAGKNVATLAGLWDKSKQDPSGYIITYNSDTLNDFGSFTKAGDVPDDPADLALVKDGAYQISVIEDNIELIMTGTR